MKITSLAFADNGSIPVNYTCDGENINPPLHFHAVPVAAQSLVLLMDDPDVPRRLRADGVWDHWVVFNIPPDMTEIVEGEAPLGIHGTSTSGHTTYHGPCPPDREHRYFFKLFALDIMLDLPPGAAKREVEQAMTGHVLAQAELVGRYERP